MSSVILAGGETVHKETCIQMFIATLFVIAPNWKPTFPSTGEWLKKLLHPYHTRLLSTIKDPPFIQAKQINQSGIVRGGKSHSSKATFRKQF